MSSKFYNKKNKRVEYKVDDRIYKIDDHEHIKARNASGKSLSVLDLSITKNVAFILFAFFIMVVVFGQMAKSYKANPIPGGIGRFLEPIILYIRDDIARPNIGEKHYKRYMSFLLTVFFFIWFVNLFGLTPFGSNVTNSIAVTASLAILTYIITTFTANKSYWGHIFWMPGVPTPMKIILAPIELLGTIIKPFSLMIRLYANMTAGHVVLMSILGLIFIFQNWLGGTLSFGLAFALALLELLVCALQAYIFTMLSALYFGSAVEEHHDGEH
jgi:F-type H+-transporting ATPase subunit a